MVDDPAVNGGIYEPVRKAICGDGVCEGKALETYRYALGCIKLVEDQIAAKCYELGREQMQKIFIEQIKRAENPERAKMEGQSDLLVLDRTPELELLLNIKSNDNNTSK